MHYSKYFNRSPSSTSTATSNRNLKNRPKSKGASDYEYVGRLVTRERQVTQKPKSIRRNHVFPPNKHKYHHSMASHYQNNEEVSGSSSDDDSDGLSKPLGIIKISDRHLREIYRLPTPPPKVKRVFHRLRSPEPKVIERVFVRRPPPQIIENVIEVPPEKVRIVTREKYLDNQEPITRSKLVHLQSRRRRRRQEQEQEEEEEEIEDEQHQHQHHQAYTPSEQYSQHEQAYIPSKQYSQHQQAYIPSKQYSQQQQYQQPVAMVPPTPVQPAATTSTSLVYPPQPNMPTLGYIQSTIPPHIMFNSKEPIHISPEQLSKNPMMPPSPYTPVLPQGATYQMAHPPAYTPVSQQAATYQMAHPTAYHYPQH